MEHTNSNQSQIFTNTGHQSTYTDYSEYNDKDFNDAVSNKHKKILIIDDDHKMVSALKRWLRVNEFNCHSSFHPLEGIEKIKTLKPDLILLDLNMPSMSGYGVLREIKKDPEICDIPVVVLTGINDKEVAMGAMDLGAISYVVKAYISKDLVPILKEFVDS